jgi:DNA polymerase-3 subunit epsilon
VKHSAASFIPSCAVGEGCFPTGKHYPGISHLLRMAGLHQSFSDMDVWVELPIAMIDLETTGFDPSVDRIIEIGITTHSGSMGRLVNPGRNIPPGLPHGITDADVRDAAPLDARALHAYLSDKLPAAYNAQFDRSFIAAEYSRVGLTMPDVEWIDPLPWARAQGEKRNSLGEVARRLGVKHEEAHRAVSDAAAAFEVLLRLAPSMPRFYGAMLAEQSRLAAEQSDERRGWKR